MKLIKFVYFTSHVVFMVRGRQSSASEFQATERDDERAVDYVHADGARMRDGIGI